MRAGLLRAAAAVLLATRGAAQGTDPYFELDVVFPRNKTYLPSEVFPISLAIQNLTALRIVGEYSILWYIMPYSNGVTPGGVAYDEGELELLEDGGDGTSIFVANSNVTAWIGKKRRGDRYALYWKVKWPEAEEKCEIDSTKVLGHIMFAVEATWDERWQTQDVDGVKPDVKEEPECPARGSVVGIRPRAGNPDCPIVMDGNTGRQGEPCNAKIDRDLASRIEEKAESMLASAAASTTTPSWRADDDEDAAPGVVPPVRATVMAAGLVGYLALAL